MRKTHAFILAALLSAAPGCESSVLPTQNRASADFVNGDFETGDLTGWTLTTNQNGGLQVVPPTQMAQLGLAPGGTPKTFARQGATPESQTPAGLTAADSLKYPRFGQYTTVVNELGNGGNSNHLSQVMTATAGDIDPLDNKIHVRFCLAPVLQNPGHPAAQQPYFYVEVNNVTKGKQLFYSFNFSGQSGVPWKTSSTGSQYTDWQLFDLAPAATDLAPGDSVQMDVIASGCVPGGHYGHVYVDAFGAFIPGLTVSASAPTFTSTNTDLTYTFQVKNGGAGSVDSVVVAETLPPGTTFVSLTGAMCTTPAVGAAGSVSCNLGTLAAGAGTSFQMTVHVDPTAQSPVTNGTYSISGTGVSSLLGPKVETQIGFPLTAQVLGGNGTLSCPAGVVQGQSATCTVTPAPGYNLLALSLDGVDVTAAVSGGAYTLSNVQAAHTLVAIFNAPTFTITASAPGGNGILNCTSPVVGGTNALCAIAPAAGYWLTALNLDGSDAMGMVNGNLVTLANVTANHLLSATFAPASYGIATSVPGGHGTLACGSPIMYGAGTRCTITPATGYLLGTLTLDGADVLGAVVGGALPIANVTAPHLVEATFQLMTNPITISIPGGNGNILCGSSIVYGQSTVCSITPDPTYRLLSVAVNGTDRTAAVANGSLTLAAITAPVTVTGVFEPIPRYDITVNVPGGNGSLACDSPVFEGANSTCMILPDDGYELDALAVDSVDARTQVQGMTLKLYDVIGPHTLDVAFKKARATSCAGSDECHSGFCADGVCCDRACDGQCEACNSAQSAGACTPVTAGASPVGHPSCGNYLCGGAGCHVECQSDAECADGAVCSNQACVVGSHRLSGGGIGGCSLGGLGGSAAPPSGLVLLSLFALLARRRRRSAAA